MQAQRDSICIDTSQIPEFVRMELLAIAYTATAEYFQQPGVAEEFAEWKAARTNRKGESI